MRLRRLSIYLLFTLSLIPVQAFALVVGWRLYERLPVFYHRVCCRLLGLRVSVVGTPVDTRPALLISNHCSYLDIPAFSTTTALSFVAKSEVEEWPLFGLLARLQRTVFVDRRRASAGRQRDAIQERLGAGNVLVLFAEGTSSDGNRVLPFKSALFSVAERWEGEEELAVQPVSIAYTHLDGVPMGRGCRPFYAWYGDMDLGSHLVAFAGLGRADVEIRFHDPVRISDYASRREMARHVESVIADGMAASICGRD